MWSQALLLITCGERDAKTGRLKLLGTAIFNGLNEKFNLVKSLV